MKIICILGLLLSLNSFFQSPKKYLPVTINLSDSTMPFKTDFLLNLKGSFTARKIKTISKKDMDVYVHNEVSSVTESYYKGGGSLGDFTKLKSYLSSNMKEVGNVLTIDLRINNDGIVHDTIKWYCNTVPFNFQKPPKYVWSYMTLDSTNSNSLMQITQSLVDSIIASNVLVRE